MSEHNFRHRMREARTARGLSQDALGQLLGKNQSQITRIESGHTAIRLDDAIAIAHLLQVPFARMCTEQPLEFTVAPTPIPNNLPF